MSQEPQQEGPDVRTSDDAEAERVNEEAEERDREMVDEPGTAVEPDE